MASGTQLEGKVIVVTRPRHQSAEFIAALESLGASIVPYPTIRICDPDSWSEVDRCMGRMAEYDAVVFTSSNAVVKFFSRGTEASLVDKTVYAVGSRTQEALGSRHTAVTIIPERFTAEDLLEIAVKTGIRGKRILYPRGSRDRGIIGEGLCRAGAEVEECIVYTTEYADPSDSADMKRMLDDGAIDMVTFFSPSSVEGFFTSLSRTFPESGRLQQLLAPVAFAVIGPVTRDALDPYGFLPSVMPPASTGEAMVQSIVEYYSLV